MKGFMADIMGVSGCSFESLLAAVSESLESLLALEPPPVSLFELPPFALSLFELLLPDEAEPPPTRFWKNSCRRPHSAGLIGIRQATRHRAQATKAASRMGPTGAGPAARLRLTSGRMWAAPLALVSGLVAVAVVWWPLVGFRAVAAACGIFLTGSLAQLVLFDCVTRVHSASTGKNDSTSSRLDSSGRHRTNGQKPIPIGRRKDDVCLSAYRAGRKDSLS